MLSTALLWFGCRFRSPIAWPRSGGLLWCSPSQPFGAPILLALDWPIEDLQAAGLPQPCVVRLKLFTLDERLVLGPLGALADGDRAAVIAQLAKLFGNPGPEVG